MRAEERGQREARCLCVLFAVSVHSECRDYGVAVFLFGLYADRRNPVIVSGFCSEKM